jgi:hypothetical protein
MGRRGSAPNPNHQQHQQRDYMVEPLGEDGAEQVVDETGDLEKASPLRCLGREPRADLGHRLRWSAWRPNIRPAPAPATTDDKPPDNHEDHPPRLEYKQVEACEEWSRVVDRARA